MGTAPDDEPAKREPAEEHKGKAQRYARAVGCGLLCAAVVAGIVYFSASNVVVFVSACLIAARLVVWVISKLRLHEATLRAKLGRAVSEGDKEKAGELVASGVPVRAEEGLGPLSMAVFKGHREIVEALLAAGAEVNPIAPELGVPPLFVAVFKGNEEMVRLLLAANADLKAVSEDPEFFPGGTALHVACVKGNRQVVEMLLAAGADASAKDGAGRTPLSFAVSGGREEIVEALGRVGAKE